MLITSNYMTSHLITSYYIISHHIASHCITSHQIALHQIISYHIKLHHIISHRITPYQFAALYCTVPYRTVLCAALYCTLPVSLLERRRLWAAGGKSRGWSCLSWRARRRDRCCLRVWCGTGSRQAYLVTPPTAGWIELIWIGLDGIGSDGGW